MMLDESETLMQDINKLFEESKMSSIGNNQLNKKNSILSTV